MTPKIIVTGSLAFDHIMSMPGKFSDHILPDKLHILNVSFIMETFRQEFGGTGGNISYNLGLLGTANLLVGSVGNDFKDYMKHLSRNSFLDTKGIKLVKNKNTARGFVITDKDDNQIWGFYEGAMVNARYLKLKRFTDKKSLVMIAPNDPQAMANYVNEAIGLDLPFVFDPAFNITHFDLPILSKAIDNAEILIGNDYEIHLIRKKLKLTRKQLLKKASIVITTLGSKGSTIELKERFYKIPAARPKNDSDPTGAGDAYRAGFLAGYVRGFPLEVCGRMGSVSSVYTVEKYGTQTHRFSITEYCSRYKANFGEELKLN